MSACMVVGRLPNSPEGFELVETGFRSATFSWSSDPHISDSRRLKYRLHYKSLSSDEDYSSIEVYECSEVSYQGRI